MVAHSVANKGKRGGREGREKGWQRERGREKGGEGEREGGNFNLVLANSPPRSLFLSKSILCLNVTGSALSVATTAVSDGYYSCHIWLTSARISNPGLMEERLAVGMRSRVQVRAAPESTNDFRL